MLYLVWDQHISACLRLIFKQLFISHRPTWRRSLFNSTSPLQKHSSHTSVFSRNPLSPLCWGRGSRGKPREVKCWGGCRFPALTVEAGEVSPVEQWAIEGGHGAVKERIGAVGRVPHGVSEQVHLQQSLDQVAQHLWCPKGPTRSPEGLTVSLCLSF